MELLDWAENQPLFNLNEAERATGHNRDYLRTKLQRAVKKGDLKRIERGKYTVHEPLVYATHVERPSYLSLWSGLRYYNLTTQTPRKVDVMTSKNRDDLEKVRFHSTKNMFGFRKEIKERVPIFVAEKEKLLIDCLSMKEVPVSELEELLEEVDIQKLAELAERTDKKSVKKRLGFLVKEFRGETVEKFKVEDRNYAVLDLSQPKGGEKNSEWMVEVNTDDF